MNLGELVKGLGAVMWQGAKGSAMVQQWEDYRYEAACQHISLVVNEAERGKNQELLGSIFTSFAERIRLAASWERQDHLSRLLWHYKVTLDAHL